MWRHLVMLNVSIGGSREGKTGGALLEKDKPPFSAYLHPPMLSMHVPYCYHRNGPHTVYYNDRHAFLFLSLSLNMIKIAPKFSSLTPPMIFGILKNGIYVKVLFIKKLQTNFHQNRTRNKDVIAILVMGWKIAKFSEIFASPIFDFFRLFIVILKVPDERNRMAFVPSKSAG